MNNQPKWFPVITRKGQPVLFNSLALTAFQDQYYQEVLLLPRGIHFLKYVGDPGGFVVLEANDVKIISQILADHVTPEYLSFFIDQCRHKSTRLLRTAQAIRSQAPYKAMDNSELAILFSAYVSDVIRVMTFLTTIVIFENVLQEVLETKLPTTPLTSLLFSPEKNIPSLAIIELYQLAAEVHSNPSLLKIFALKPAPALSQIGKKFPTFKTKLDTYLEKYDFMDMEYYAGRPLLTEELFTRIKDMIGNSKDKLTRIRQDRQRTEQEFKQVTNSLKLTPELRALIASVQAIHYLRQHRADALFKAGRDVLGLLKTISKRLNINYASLITLLHDEILASIVKGKLTVDQQTIQVRQQGYAILWVDQKLSIVTGDLFIQELTAFPTVKKQIKEFHGNSAFLGKYRGPVKIVTRHEEINKIQPGDVLVSPMTDPYFVPAMVKAGAIITDEGGILSHAAIVSRELGIPCIIGTKIATSVLKDGFIVEVDASRERGIIRIITNKDQ